MRLALIANPESGAGDAGATERLLAAEGAEVCAVLRVEEAEAAGASGAERIVVAGGDGSIGCAAAAAGAAGVPLAVLPVGTANDFARALGIPLDASTAARVAVRGEELRALDLGRFGERPFVNAASAGLSPVAAHSARGLKRALGTFAYVAGALRAGLRAHPISYRLRCDGGPELAGSAWQVTIGLTGAFGGGATVEADPRDGLLDVVAIEAGSRLRLVVHGYGLRAGRIEDQANVLNARAREVEIETEGGAGFNVDGELLPASAARVTVEPRAFEAVVA